MEKHKMIEDAGLCRFVEQVCALAEKKREEGQSYSDSCFLFNEAYCENQDGGETLYHISIPRSEYSSLLTAAEDKLNFLVLEQEKRNTIAAGLKKLQEKRFKLLHEISKKKPFPKQEIVSEYLEEYRQLLRKLIACADVFADFYEQGSELILDILNLDISVSEKTCMYASLYSPASLEALLHSYDYVQQYMEATKDWTKSKEMNLLRVNYQGVIIAKLLRHFRWMLMDREQLLQAALPAALPIGEVDEKDSSILDIRIRELSDYSSYEGIGELRLFDKIIYELDQRSFDNDTIFNIMIVGDLLKDPINELSQAVENYLIYKAAQHGSEEKWRQIHVFLTILTKNRNGKTARGASERERVRYKGKEYSGQLVNSMELDKMINENDLLFFLDACDLYRGFIVEDKDAKLLLEEIDNNPVLSIAQIQQALYSVSFSGVLGSLKKEINQSVLRYLTFKLSPYEKKKKSAYVYLSDLEAVGGLEFLSDYLIRLEQYNEKEFLILRLSDQREGELPQESHMGRKLIVMNLWQVIKHSTVRNIDYFLCDFGLNSIPEGIIVFRETLIGVGYDCWKQELKFSYHLPEILPIDVKTEDYQKKVEWWIEQGIMPYFKEQDRTIFYEYYIKAFGSFLYSDAKSVDDMLFRHLFVNQHERLVGKTVWDDRKQNAELLKYQSVKCKYSQKQFYQTFMEDYDTSSWDFPYKRSKLSALEEADFLLHKRIFQNILASCKRNDYSGTYLEVGCEQMIEEMDA